MGGGGGGGEEDMSDGRGGMDDGTPEFEPGTC